MPGEYTSPLTLRFLRDFRKLKKHSYKNTKKLVKNQCSRLRGPRTGGFIRSISSSSIMFTYSPFWFLF